MNKTKQDLIDVMAVQADISKVAAETALNAFINTVTETLSEGGKVSIINFGSFETAKRSARTGRNPQTGKEIAIPEATIAKFKVGKKLKEAVNNHS